MDLGLKMLSDITTFGKYAKYVPEVKRRESWDEIVDRYELMQMKKFPSLRKEILEKGQFIRNKKVLPSMRAMQFAGVAMEVNNARGYNCAYLPVDSLYSFSETMFLLLGGSGVGYSVQKHHIDQLPEIKKASKSRKYLIQDSIIGWADSIKMLMKGYFGGKTLPDFDYRDIRAKGARLITAGGKAPGPEPLKICIAQIQEILDRKKDGEKLTSLECHDIQCHIANSVLAGGIRRSAMIALFSHDDMNMITCKSPVTPVKIDLVEENPDYKKVIIFLKDGREVTKDFDNWSWEEYLKTDQIGWWVTDEQRGRANNSAILKRGEVFEEEFKDIWTKIELSKSGEPGIYWTNDLEWGTNPCCEIALKPFQFCNLCEVNVSNIESQWDLNERVMAAAFFGTLQASYTDFHYLRPIWKQTTEKESLLGVGMTGIGSGEILKYDLQVAARLAESVNLRVSELIGINPAARITTIKPSGTTSCVLECSSGIHAWYGEFYLRTIRLDKTEELAKYAMEFHPYMCEDDLLRPKDTVCIRIPIKSPKGAILRTETALDTLERVKKFSREWIKPGHMTGANTHNVSATIFIDKTRTYGDISGWGLKDTKSYYDEWEVVGTWMWENREFYNGLSILPFDGGTYIQAPFEDISKEEYEKRISQMQELDLSKVIEEDDNVHFGAIAACSGGACEIAA